MAGLISPSTLEQIRSASDIVEIVGNVLPLKRAGANFTALCPFHKEKTPSFSVNPAKQIFYCFGCHKGGDVFTFLQEYEGLSFPEAVRRLAERAGIALELTTEAGDPQRRYLKEALLQIHDQIARRWHAVLLHEAPGQVARQYLASRQMPPEAIELFQLGFAPDAWDDTVNWAKSKGFEPAIVEQAGLIIRKEDRYYDRFRGRLMFPICDEQGRVVAFSGRVLSAEAPGGKYVNSPETPIFTKGRVFFGLDKSKRAILDAQCAIVCEGQIDLIRCFISGIKNIVAPQGTALTPDHARILKRYASEVVLCFDSDSAGQQATERSLDSLLAVDLAIRVAVIPPPHDPDSLIRSAGASAFQSLIDRAEGFFDFLLNRCCRQQDVTTDKGRLAVTRTMAEALGKTGNPVLIDTYAQKTAHRIGVTPEAIRAEFRRQKSGPKPQATMVEAMAESPPASSRPSSLEFWLLRLLLMEDDLVEWVAGHLDPSWVPDPLVRQIVTLRLEAQAQHGWAGVASLIHLLPEPQARALISEAVAETRPIPNRAQQMADVVLRLRNQHLDRRINDWLRRLADPTTPESERLALMQQLQQLRQERRQPLASLVSAPPPVDPP